MRGGETNTNTIKKKHNQSKKRLKQNTNTIITQIVLTRANKKVPSHAGKRETQTNTETIRKQSKCLLIKKRRETQTKTDTIKKQPNSSSIRTRINNQLETQ